jgi:hypothetical protein
MRSSLSGLRFALPLAAAALLGLVSTAGAQIVNGDFSSNLSGYNTYGTNVNVTTAAAIGENDDPLAVGSNVALLNTSATATGGAGPSIAASTLETDLNLTAGTFSAYTVGSALSQTFNSFAGNKLSFDANFLTNDALPYNDAAYYYVLGPSNTVVASGLIGSVTTAGSNATPGTDNLFTGTETGWNSFPATTLTLGTTGTYELEFVVLNANANSLSSGLMVDNIVLNPNTGPSSVPLPRGLWTGLLGSMLVAGCALRIRRKAALV